MPRILIAVIASAVLALTFAACSGDDKDDDGDATPSSGTPAAERTREPRDGDGEPSEREDDLRAAVSASYKAIFAGGAVEAYKFASDDFKEKCSFEDFAGMIALVRIFLGEVKEDDVEVTITSIRYEDDRAFVTASGTIAGEEFSPDDGEDNELSEFWVYEDGAWKWGTDEEEPCDSSFDSGSSEDATPATGPGSSRAEAAPIGEAVESGDLRITVLEADTDAGDRLEGLSEFPSTPTPGRRAVLARVRVEHIGADGDETVQVYESDFKVTGSGNVVYDSFGDDTSCGFLTDSLDGEMFPGGSLEGYVCVQVPASETDLLLIAQPSFTFTENVRRYFALE